MGRRIELPQTPAGKPEEQLKQLYSYLYQMAEALNNNLAEIGGTDFTDAEMVVVREIIGDDGTAQDGRAEAETLKSLIIKTATLIKSELDEYRLHLLGDYVAEGKFGKYVRRTGLDVDVTPTGIQQNYTFQEIIQGLKTYEINAKNYIKTGLLRTVSSIPVYGVAIGKDVVTFSEDGTETYNDGNKVAELTADELSFYQNGSKIAGYKGNRISFYYGGTEKFYIAAGKIYCTEDLEISSGKKLILNTDNFSIDSSGNVTIKGNVQVLNGKGLSIKTGGTLSIDSGNFSIDSSGNVIMKGAAEILSGKELKIKSGGAMTVESGGGLNVNSGGNMTVKSGGNLNIEGGGTIAIKDGNTNAIVMNKDGIDMQTAGKVNIHAKDGTQSSIIFGTNEATAPFAVGLNGDVKARSITAGAISVNGTDLPGIIISETQPSGNNILWIKPSSATDKQWSKTPDSYQLNNSGGTLGWYRDFTIPYSADDYLSGSLYYGIKVRLYYYAQSFDNVTIKARLQNGNSWIDLGSSTSYTGYGSNITLDNMLGSVSTNLMNVSGGNFTVRLETNMGPGYCRLVTEDFIFKAKTQSGGGFAACSVFYKS